MKIISFNINSIRARPHQVEAIVKKHKPDAIGLQETKVHDDDFPYEIPESLGYKAHIHGQKGHYGVAILTKEEPLNVNKGFETDDDESQKRFISVTLKKDRKKIHILNGYFPQGEEREHPVKFPYKGKLYKDRRTHKGSPPCNHYTKALGRRSYGLWQKKEHRPSATRCRLCTHISIGLFSRYHC